MKFDKSKVYTALNADEVKVGSRGYFADDIGNLRDMVINREPLLYVKEVRNDYYQYRFKSDEINKHALFYLVEEPKTEPKEVTAAEWDNKPRIMKVWNGDNYSNAVERKVLIVRTSTYCYPVVTIEEDERLNSFQHCAELEPAKSYRPYHNADEFIEDYKKRFYHDFKDIPTIWMKNKAGVLKKIIISNDGFVDYCSLFDTYTYPDGSPCGMEE